MKNKKLKILFLYPNLNMSTLVPNAISILTAILKQAGFNNIDLFDTTFYQSDGLSKDEDRVKVGQVQPFNFDERIPFTFSITKTAGLNSTITLR